MMSFFVSRTVTPLLCLLLAQGATARRRAAASAARSRASSTRLDDALRARARLGARATALVTVARHPRRSSSPRCSSRSCIGTEFFPESDEAQFTRHLQDAHRHAGRADRAGRRSGSRTSSTQTLAPDGRAAALHDDDLRQRPARWAATALFTPNTGPHAGNVQVNLVPHDRAADLATSQATREGARGAARRAARHAGLLLHRRHREAHPQLRLAGAHRRRDPRLRPRRRRARYAKQVAGQAARRSRDADGQPLLTDVQISREENYPELDVVVDRAEGRRARAHRAADRPDACSPSLVGNTQFAPIPFTDPKTGNEYFINVRLDDRVPLATSPTSATSSCARPRAAMVPLDTVAHDRARQRPGASSTASTCSASST